jgi:hypothetical protein
MFSPMNSNACKRPLARQPKRVSGLKAQRQSFAITFNVSAAQLAIGAIKNRAPKPDPAFHFSLPDWPAY